MRCGRDECPCKSNQRFHERGMSDKDAEIYRQVRKRADEKREKLGAK